MLLRVTAPTHHNMLLNETVHVHTNPSRLMCAPVQLSIVNILEHYAHKLQVLLRHGEHRGSLDDSPMLSSYFFFPLFSFSCLYHPRLLLLHLHHLWVIWSQRWDAAFSRLFSSCVSTWEAFFNPPPLLIYFTFMAFCPLLTWTWELNSNLGGCDVYEYYVVRWRGQICTLATYTVTSALVTMRAAHFTYLETL